MKNKYVLRKRTLAESRAILRTRYTEQTLRFPSMRNATTEAEYVKANERAAMRYAALTEEEGK